MTCHTAIDADDPATPANLFLTTGEWPDTIPRTSPHIWVGMAQTREQFARDARIIGTREALAEEAHHLRAAAKCERRAWDLMGRAAS